MVYILSDTPVEGAKRLPVIEQRFFDEKIDFSSYDYLIVTSKNALLAAEKIDPSWKETPLIAISDATAKKALQMGAKVAYVGSSGYGDELANEIVRRFDPKKHYLYLRGKKVLSRLVPILKEAGFRVDERIVYETVCVECEGLEPPPKGSTIIFSSPSTIECFLRCFEWDESYKAVAIGKKTASFFPYQIALCPKPSLQEAVEFAKSLENRI